MEAECCISPAPHELVQKGRWTVGSDNNFGGQGAVSSSFVFQSTKRRNGFVNWEPSWNLPMTQFSGRLWTESSRAGTKEQKRFTVTSRTKSSANPSQCWFQPTAKTKRRRSLVDSRGERLSNHYETVRRRKDGQEIQISLTISPIRNLAGRIIGASSIAQVVFLSDGGDSVRNLLQAYLHPDSELWLDWFHITMRISLLQQQGENCEGRTAGGTRGDITPSGRRRQHSPPHVGGARPTTSFCCRNERRHNTPLTIGQISRITCQDHSPRLKANSSRRDHFPDKL